MLMRAQAVEEYDTEGILQGQAWIGKREARSTRQREEVT